MKSTEKEMKRIMVKNILRKLCFPIIIAFFMLTITINSALATEILLRNTTLITDSSFVMTQFDVDDNTGEIFLVGHLSTSNLFLKKYDYNLGQMINISGPGNAVHSGFVGKPIVDSDLSRIYLLGGQ